MVLSYLSPLQDLRNCNSLTQGFTLGFAVEPFQGSLTKHAGTAEAVVYLNIIIASLRHMSACQKEVKWVSSLASLIISS